jgi:RNA ligase
MCRGLILDEKGKVIARPLSKFFNVEELDKLGITIPEISFEIFEKMDGSLGIIYRDTDQVYKVATRGSFNSDQAIYATNLLHEKYSHVLDKLKDDRTYLVEIIFPENRIVVNYGLERKLVLLAILDKETGKDYPLEDIGFPLPKIYDGVSDYKDIRNKIEEEPNKEGYVVKFSNGFRMKVKLEEYVRLHRIVTGINERSVWEMLLEGNNLDSLLEKVPEEFETWIKEVSTRLCGMHQIIYKVAYDKFIEIRNDIPFNLDKTEARKFFAKEVFKRINKEYSHLAFLLFDNKNPSKEIWEMIKPSGEKSFFGHKDEEK